MPIKHQKSVRIPKDLLKVIPSDRDICIEFFTRKTIQEVMANIPLKELNGYILLIHKVFDPLSDKGKTIMRDPNNPSFELYRLLARTEEIQVDILITIND